MVLDLFKSTIITKIIINSYCFLQFREVWIAHVVNHIIKHKEIEENNKRINLELREDPENEELEGQKYKNKVNHEMI